jgi:hypothetical protein
MRIDCQCRHFASFLEKKDSYIHKRQVDFLVVLIALPQAYANLCDSRRKYPKGKVVIFICVNPDQKWPNGAKFCVLTTRAEHSHQIRRAPAPLP